METRTDLDYQVLNTARACGLSVDVLTITPQEVLSFIIGTVVVLKKENAFLKRKNKELDERVTLLSQLRLL